MTFFEEAVEKFELAAAAKLDSSVERDDYKTISPLKVSQEYYEQLLKFQRCGIISAEEVRRALGIKIHILPS